MNRIDKVFSLLKEKGKTGFIAYITAGDPSPRITGRLIRALSAAGADIIELGVPFSDPMADGLTNQRAAERALANGTTLYDVLCIVKEAREKTSVPLVLFTYLNPVFRYGWQRFARDAAQSGVDGVLVLDLPAEESEDKRRMLLRHNIKMIYLLAPTSPDERIKLICGKASGFIYLVSRTGVTGARDRLEAGIMPMVARIKKYTDIPVAVGFGISKASHVREASKYADAVVVGSAIVSRIEQNLGKQNIVKKAAGLVREIKSR